MIELEFREPVIQTMFYELIEQLWPKYLQAFFFEMARDLKQKPLSLDESEFHDLPDSCVKNLDDFDLFEDYLTADIQIEMCRAVKLRSCYLLVELKTRQSLELDTYSDDVENIKDRRQKEIRQLVEICIRDYLDTDYEVLYEGLKEKLGKNKWSKHDTDAYLNNAFSNWYNDVE